LFSLFLSTVGSESAGLIQLPLLDLVETLAPVDFSSAISWLRVLCPGLFFGSGISYSFSGSRSDFRFWVSVVTARGSDLCSFVFDLCTARFSSQQGTPARFTAFILQPLSRS
jgi:hypothetical protein